MKNHEAQKILDLISKFTKIFDQHYPLDLEPTGDGSLLDKGKMMLSMFLPKIYEHIYRTYDVQTMEYNAMLVILNKDLKIISYSNNHEDPIVEFPEDATDLSILDYLSPISQNSLKDRMNHLKVSEKSGFQDLTIPLNLQFSEFFVIPVTGLLTRLKAPEFQVSLKLLRHQIPKNEYQKARLKVLPANYSEEKVRKMAQQFFRDQEILNHLREYVDRHLNGPLPSWHEIEREIGFSRSKLNRDFKKRYNITVYNYHMQRRLEEAILQIEKTRKPFKKIARDFGLSESSFAKYIKGKSGHTPSQLRKMGSKDN